MKKRLLSDSDVLWIKGVQHKRNLKKTWYIIESIQKIREILPIKYGKVVVIGDCGHVDVFSVRKNNFPITLSKQYQSNAQIGVFASIVFYIADTLRKNGAGNSIYALYSTDFNGRTLELIEGAEKLQVSIIEEGGKKKLYFKILLTSVEPAEVFKRSLSTQTIDSDRIMRVWYDFKWSLSD